jgi:hypothetical protein
LAALLARASTLGAVLVFAVIVLCVLLTLATLLGLAPLALAALILTTLALATLVLTTLVLVRHGITLISEVDTQEVRPSGVAWLSDPGRGEVKDHLRPASA